MEISGYNTDHYLRIKNHKALTAWNFSSNALFWMHCKNNGLFYIFDFLTMIWNGMVMFLFCPSIMPFREKCSRSHSIFYSWFHRWRRWFSADINGWLKLLSGSSSPTYFFQQEKNQQTYTTCCASSQGRTRGSSRRPLLYSWSCSKLLPDFSTVPLPQHSKPVATAWAVARSS